MIGWTGAESMWTELGGSSLTSKRSPPGRGSSSLSIAQTVFRAFSALPVYGEDPPLALQTAGIGWVGHEAGTLRMAEDGSGVVNADLKFLSYQNLYACDNSIFPVSPAANPSLTLAALALRLASHLTQT